HVAAPLSCALEDVLVSQPGHDGHHRGVRQRRASPVVQPFEHRPHAERAGGRPHRPHDLGLERAEQATAIRRSHASDSLLRPRRTQSDWYVGVTPPWYVYEFMPED